MTKGPIRFWKTKWLSLDLLLKGLKSLRCSLTPDKPLWFFSLCQMVLFTYKSNFSNFVFPAEWQNLIRPLRNLEQQQKQRGLIKKNECGWRRAHFTESEVVFIRPGHPTIPADSHLSRSSWCVNLVTFDPVFHVTIRGYKLIT